MEAEADLSALAFLLLVTAMLLQLLMASAASVATTLPGCRSSCGGMDVPYPFGIGANCSIRKSFAIDCTKAADGSEKAVQGDVELLNISLPQGQIRFLNQISSQCRDPTNMSILQNAWYFELADGYRFSDTKNKFTVIGCSTLAFIGDGKDGERGNAKKYESGCVATCPTAMSVRDGSCVGGGCCQIPIPKDLAYYQVWFGPVFNTTNNFNSSNCSYAVLMETASFQFRTSFLTTHDFNKTNGAAPVVLDWVVGEETCAAAKLNTSYACKSENSECVDTTNGLGYLCNCSKGYRGNPYLKNGCQDIDECAEDNQKSCKEICKNLPGDYECLCWYGNPVNGTCYPRQKLPVAVKLAIGICSSIAFLLLCSMFIYMIYQRKQLTKVKEKYFKEHGGWQLLEEMNGRQGLIFKIFTIRELERATHNFDKNQILGRGGHGTVYKGILEDNHVVAIKRSKFIDESQKKEYGKEMLILSQVNHKNIVKLLGCCLEVDVPILVYEFVPNGTLFHLIHEKRNISPLSLGARLNIAYESADALAYLHSTASPPIIHGDVKSSNILLDENFIAKISDFGASKLVPKDKDQLATLVQGTCGYLDPEYLQTCQLTDKSDVYSFGVVFLELLTGKKAVYFEESEEEKSLALSFLLAMKENRLLEILDNQEKDDGDTEYIQKISELAKRCLRISGEERPTMREVAEELDKLRKLKRNPGVPNNEVIEYELGETSNNQEIDTTTHYTSEKISALNIESGR